MGWIALDRVKETDDDPGPPTMSKEIRLLSTSAILGYGFPEASLKAGLDRKPDMIGVDGGSVDPGPHYLGVGKPFCSPIAIRRDLRLMLNAAIRQGIPLVIGTCGGAGGAPHLKLVADVAREIAREMTESGASSWAMRRRLRWAPRTALGGWV